MRGDRSFEALIKQAVGFFHEPGWQHHDSAVSGIWVLALGEDGVGHVESLDEGDDFTFRRVFEGYAPIQDAGLVGLVEAIELGHLVQAGRALGGPEVDQQSLPAVVGDAVQPAVEVSGLEVVGFVGGSRQNRRGDAE